MEEFVREAVREMKGNQENLEARVRLLENQVHTLRENEISRRVADNERSINTIEASYKTTRIIGGILIAVLTLLLSFQGNWSCSSPTHKHPPAKGATK